MPEQSFASRLAALREAAGLTPYALGKLAGVDRTQLSRFERGEREPTLDTLRKLCRALGVSLAEFDEDQGE